MILILSFQTCQAQVNNNDDKKVGGPCEDCEAALDYQMLKIMPTTSVTLSGFDINEPRIRVHGIVYHPDGKTPAPDVVLYIYHTGRNGLYEPGKKPKGYERRHGQYRGWMKTNAEGKFEFYTFRPGAYPDRREPEHIHLYIKEDGKIPYYVDSYFFDDDPLLTKSERASAKNRGGSGIISLKMQDGILTANRDIILGLNIPNY